MIRNYIKIALRNFQKQKLYTLINISGLTVGMTSFILIALYIQFELSYDLHHEKADRIYRIAQTQEGNIFRGTDQFAVTPLPLGEAMVKEFPEVEAACTWQTNFVVLSKDETVFTERGLVSDEFIFDVFSINVLEGEGRAALNDPQSILLTESLAKKFFPEGNAIGQSILYDNEKELTVKGILEDTPKNQHFDFDYLTALDNYGEYQGDVVRWNSNNYRTYIVLEEGANPDELDEKMHLFDEILIAGYSELPFYPDFFLQNVLDIHLFSNINFEAGANNDIRYIYLFMGIALIILLLASINYMNLATAQSARRTKEVGVRKVLGARRGQLVYQLLTESSILSLVSFVLACQLASLLLPAFSQLLDKPIPFSLLANGWVLVLMFLVALAIGTLSGLYPAIFFSIIAPVKALKGDIKKNHKEGALLRNTLVIGQFATAIILAIGSFVIYQQLQFIQNKKIGFNRDQVIHVPFFDGTIFEKQNVLREELLKHPGIQKVSIASNHPVNTGNQGIIDEWEGRQEDENLYIYRNYVDYEFLDLYEIELLEGRNFSPEYPTDSAGSYILNESAVKALGWESAVGKEFYNGKVIGVMKDFHFQPMDLKIEPLFLCYSRYGVNSIGQVAIKMSTDDAQPVLNHVNETVKSIFPQIPLNTLFLDDTYKQLYESERRIGQTFGIFTLLSLFIACMGLIGLVSYTVVQRTKEIGIRKVLGASVSSIVQLISKDFMRLVLFALLIAVPVSWYFTQQWLSNFAYHIPLSWWLFATVGGITLAIAFMTISFQSIQAALSNPVEALRKE